jgi:hypothetical protein
MATLLKTDGSRTEVAPKNPKEGFRCAEMYELIGNGCDIVQMIYLADGVTTMWLDEESKLKRNPPPINWAATKLLAEAGGIPGDVVLGNVLLCGEGEVR